MARDIKLQLTNDFDTGDLIYNKGVSDLEREEGLGTAVLISLFTDRRAEKDDPVDDINDRRGWWADQTTENNDKIGSKLWLLNRSKTTTENIRKAKIYIEEALQWMIDDGVAAKLIVNTFRFGDPGNDRLGASIQILQADGEIVAFEYLDLWEAQFGI